MAQRGAGEQSDLIETTRAFLRVVARSYATFAGSGEGCGSFLANLITGLPWAKAISVIEPDGQAVCSSNPGSIGRNIADRPHFRRAVQTGEFLVSDYLFGQRLPGPNLVAMLPQRAADGSIDVVVSGVLDVSWLGRLADAATRLSGSDVLMVDGTGTVVAHQPDPGHWVGRKVGDHDLVRQLMARPEGTITQDGLDGVRRLYGFVRLPGTEARLAVGLDAAEVLHRVDRAMWTSYGQLGFITAIVLVGIWYGGERLFVQPIHALAGTAKRFGQGELEARTAGRPWAAEFVPLAAALDDMAGRLSARERKLRASNSRLETLAQMDGLTGLANRRTFDARLESEWRLALPLARPVALLLVDLDYFKRLNDHDGHLAGDACLRTLGKVLEAAVRKGDLAARYGGEEFALLLPGAGLADAINVAERLRAAVANLRLPHAAAPLGHVTVSIGVASLVPQRSVRPQTLIETADAGLYEAKRRGRNTVATYEPAALAAAG